MEQTKIEWTHNTFNPWIGCSKVSEGCAHCYAEELDRRRKYTLIGWGPGRPRMRTTDAWKKPSRWNRQASERGARTRVFCASLADVLDDEVPSSWRSDLWKLMEQTPLLDWQVLTKRPQHYRCFMPRAWEHQIPGHIWCGTSVENQKRAVERVPALLQVPARIRFLSVEPLLGPIDLRPWLRPSDLNAPGPAGSGIHWVIVGGESGPGSRPMHPDWVRSLRDQCAEAGVAFFFKQWGSFFPVEVIATGYGSTRLREPLPRVEVQAAMHWGIDGRPHPIALESMRELQYEPCVISVKMPKSEAGHVLDGAIHQAFPHSDASALTTTTGTNKESSHA